MNEHEVANAIQTMIAGVIAGDHNGEFKGQMKRVMSYRAAGLAESVAGFVVTLGDGSEFQVTVIKSK